MQGPSHQSSSDGNRIQGKTWTSNEEYSASGLKKIIHGNDYQLKLLMLFAFKGERSEVFFRLATEMTEAEKFDDLVFRYTESKTNKIKYRFLQAKHRQFLREENKIKVSELIHKDNKDFSLQKYFVSYLKDIENSEFQDGVIEDFIICTNTDFDFEPSTRKKDQQRTKNYKERWKTYFSEKTDHDTFLNLGGKRYQFNKDASIRNNIIRELTPIFQETLNKNQLSIKEDNIKEKIDDFLDKLVFAVDQPSGEILEQKIKDTIGNEFNLINDIVYNNFFKFMHDWMKHFHQNLGEVGDGKAHFLTHKDVKKFLSEARQKIASLGLISSTILCTKKIEKFGLKFNEDSETVKEIRTFLSKQNGKKQILIICSETELLSEIKVSQVLTDPGTKRKERTIFSDLKSLDLLRGSEMDPVSAFSSQEKDCLIITSLSEDAKSLLNEFYEIVEKDSNKKIILIIKPKQNDNIQNLFQKLHVQEIEDNNNKLDDLSADSKAKMLETEITFFGEKRKLLSLTTTEASKNSLYSAINGDALTTLIDEDSIIIGGQYKYDFDTYIDIPRTLIYQTKIDKKCLQENKNDVFAIDATERDFSELVPKDEKKREFIDKDPDENDASRLATTPPVPPIVLNTPPAPTQQVVPPSSSSSESDAPDSDGDEQRLHISHSPPPALPSVTVPSTPIQPSAPQITHPPPTMLSLNTAPRPTENLYCYCQCPYDEVSEMIACAGKKCKIKWFHFKCVGIMVPPKSKWFCTDCKNVTRFIRLDNYRDIMKDFDQLCRDYNKYNIHWLENMDGVLEWKKSYGSLFNLRRFVLKKKVQKKQINELTNSAIIAAEAGMGKSTILTTYSINKDSLWPIRINLKHYQTEIINANFDDLSGIVAFLSNVIDPVSSKTSLINNLLEYCLKQKDQVTLLLDGFDEIKDFVRKKVVRLLRTVRTTEGKVFITTRSYARSELEDALGIFAYFLNPIDKKGFLQKFWIERLNVQESTKKDKVINFTSKLLKNLKFIKKKGLIGIALQARMVAEIFQDECKKYFKDEKFNSADLEITNISDLYERFVKYQYLRYFTKININEKLGEISRISLINSYAKGHGDLALKSLFSEDQIQGLLKKVKFSSEELQDIGLIKTLKNDGTADFLHPTYAEYFAADLLVDALRKKKDHPKYTAVYYFLLTQIFRDNNKVIYVFIENKVKTIENDSNLYNNWKTIQDCNLLKDVTIQAKLPFNNLSEKIKSYDTLSVKSLSELQQDVEKCMNWISSLDYYYYNNDSNCVFIKKLFEEFVREENIKTLTTTFIFILKANGKSRYGKANIMFENNILKAIQHYHSQVIQQNMLNDEVVQKILKEIEIHSELEMKLKNFRVSNTDENIKNKQLKEIIDILIPEVIKTLADLQKLSYWQYFCDIFYSDIIDSAKSYIGFAEDTQKEYIMRIINSLHYINCGNNGVIDKELTTYKTTFFIAILHHPSAIAYTKLKINAIYGAKDKNESWLERQGVLISRVLEILTPEMSKNFNSILDETTVESYIPKSGTYLSYYSDGIFIDLIKYIVNRIGKEELPQIDKLAFLKMLVRFVGFSIKADKKFPFTFEQFETTLKFVTGIINGQRKSVIMILECIEYLSLLRKVGLKLIGVDKELLVIDPAGEFEYKFSNDYMNQIIELFKWKTENPSKTQKEFLEECYKILEFKKYSRKRRGSI